VLQEEGFGELLPGAEVVIFDEAHHLPDIATQFFSTTFSSRQIIELVNDTIIHANKEAKDTEAIIDLAIKLRDAIPSMRNALGHSIRRAPWPQNLSQALEESITDVKNSLNSL